MTAFSDGAPCWADAMFPDLGAAKEFYGELLGWTYDESSPDFGGYTQANVNGKPVGAVVPQLPEMAGQPAAWNLYFASSDVAATAEQITANGGKLLMEPMPVGEFGKMVSAQDPSGVHFSVWQAGQHQGFEAMGGPGSFCWAEVNTRDTAAADAFFPAVFGFGVKRVVDDTVDFHVWEVDGAPVIGRCKMGDDIPAEVPPYISVYFGVEDCDEAVATVQRLGGQVFLDPMTMPFGRFAVVADQQGAAFAVIDTTTTGGEMPEFAPPER
ncbi:VOC family protein [Streptomyces sp. B-S-A8]|uniref:VOC family protein n=1 Tax=Streptomyces solicavernae TaxID=3043614 RepID=A0ABT6RW17_9ACTN|nr:VOC family protein [Streptomyces sp. B-S-A8]MDI3388530.1 VOC family protein [Streptomyces sp. B-S-A8]